MNKADLTQMIFTWSNLYMRLSMHDFSTYTREIGLSLAQMSVLHHLQFKGPCEVMRLCEYMQLSPAGASQMVERMVQLGLVQRVESTEDRRVRIVHLTEHGKKIVDESVSGRQVWIQALVNGLSEEEVIQISEGLQVLNQKSDALIHHDSPQA